MKTKFIISLLIAILRVLFAYLVCLLFTTNFNVLEWSTTAKVWFIVISVVLVSND